MALISAEAVRGQWTEIAAWSEAQGVDAARRFGKQQPVVNAYILASLDEEESDAAGLAFQLAWVIDAVYARALGRAPRRVAIRVMEAAHDEVEGGFESLIDVEPELAIRRLLFQRDLVEPELFAELMRLTFEIVDDQPGLMDAMGVVLMTVKSVALAYERANGLAGEGADKGSVGEVMEKQLGGPLPKIGRNDPCPCGSGRKFKKCCGEKVLAEGPPPPESPGERLFMDYMTVVERIMRFRDRLASGKDSRWLQREEKQFDKRFRAGRPGGIPDSLHVGYVLLDIPLPTAGETVAQQLLHRKGRSMHEADRARLQDLSDSYASLYEIVELCPEQGTKRVRELLTGTEWQVYDIDDPFVEFGESDDVWFCRLVGPRDAAVTLMAPLVYPSESRDDFEGMMRELMAEDPAGGGDIAVVLRATMKRSVPFWAQYIVDGGGAPLPV